MDSLRYRFLLAAVLFAAAVPARAQSFDWSKVAPAEKLMARRAARLDALRELGELVKSLPVGNGRTIGDLQPDISLFLAGATEVGEPRYLASGWVKLTMRLPAGPAMEQAAALGRARGEGLDMTALRAALGVSLEATGLGRPRSLARKAPRDERQGSLEQPKRRVAQRKPAQEPQRTEKRLARRGEDPRSEQWRREWKRQSDDWERRWREDAEQWRRKQNAWEAERAKSGSRWRSLATMPIGKQWEMGKPLGNGWRLLPDGSMIRLLSETITPVRVIRRGKNATPRWGEELLEETVTEQVIEQRIIIR